MKVTETTSFGAPALRIETATGAWLYELDAGGFASLVDVDGVEWIGFAPGEDSPYGPANVFRGIPNMVYPDNIGHPGHRHCASTWRQVDDEVVISTESRNGLWSWCWTVDEIGARLQVLTAPVDRAYWFLYEGIPGGRYDTDRATWGARGGEQEEPATTPGHRATGRPGGTLGEGGPRVPPAPMISDPATGSWKQAWFGHPDSPRVLRLEHETAGGEPSFLGWMKARRPDGTSTTPETTFRGTKEAVETGAGSPGQTKQDGTIDRGGMVVFGFGRSHADGPVSHLSGSHRFSVRLIDAADPWA